jgi:hypothetical protein
MVRAIAAAFFALVLVVVLGAAAGASPTATMAHDSGLTDGEVTSVTGSGWPANTNIQMLECSGTLASLPHDAISCDGFSEDVTTYSDIRGNFADVPNGQGGANGFHVTVLPTAKESGVVIACDARHPCVLFVGVDHNNFNAPHAWIPLNFAGASTASSSSSSSAAVVVVVVLVVITLGTFVFVRRRRSQPSR